MLLCNIAVTIVKGVVVLLSGSWSFSNISANLFTTDLSSAHGIPGWIFGIAFLITPYFGFETVPQMVEEGIFRLKIPRRLFVVQY